MEDTEDGSPDKKDKKTRHLDDKLAEVIDNPFLLWLLFVIFKYSDWMLKFFNQSNSLKMCSMKFMLKSLYRIRGMME